jgi:hypothetical protein
LVIGSCSAAPIQDNQELTLSDSQQNIEDARVLLADDDDVDDHVHVPLLADDDDVDDHVPAHVHALDENYKPSRDKVAYEEMFLPNKEVGGKEKQKEMNLINKEVGNGNGNGDTGGPYKWSTPPGRQIFYVTIGICVIWVFWLGISFCCCFCNCICPEPCCIRRSWFMGIPTVLSVFAMLFGFLMCLGISYTHGESPKLSWMKTGSMVGGVYSVKMIDGTGPPKFMASGEEFPRSELFNQGAVSITWSQCVDLLGSDVAAAYASRNAQSTLRGLSISFADKVTRMLPAPQSPEVVARNQADQFTGRYGDGCDRCSRLSGAVTAFTIIATILMIPMFVCTATRTNHGYDTPRLKFTAVLMSSMVVLFQAAALFLYEFGCATYIADEINHRGIGFIYGIVSFSCACTVLFMNLVLAFHGVEPE